MIIDGKLIANDILQSLAQEAAKFEHPLSLGIVMANNNAVIESFVRIKERAAAQLNIGLMRETLPDTCTTQDAINAIRSLVVRVDKGVRADGIIVQLPLPAGVDTDAVLASIPRGYDVDAVNPTIQDSDRPVRAPVAEAVMEILTRAGVAVRGKQAVVVGEGRLVGKPAAYLLSAQGAKVTVIGKGAPLTPLGQADIIVSGAGEPGLITPDLIKQGAVLIDAGTSEAEGKVAGDADPACAEKCSVFTPVPGGVGPVAVAMIFKNLITLARHA